MASNGIRDRVAIVGMGCTPFGEHWDKGAADLLIDAATGSVPLGQVDPRQVDAYWLGTMASGLSGPHALRAAQDPVQAGHPRREHVRHRERGDPQCRLRRRQRRLRPRDGDRRREAKGFRLLRPRRSPHPPSDGTDSNMTAPATFSFLAPAYAKKYGARRGGR